MVKTYCPNGGAFCFNGFKAGLKIARLSQEIMLSVGDIAPGDSNCFGSISKSDDTYECVIEVLSKNGPFFGYQEALSPEAAIKGAYRRIMKVLNFWRSQAHAEQSKSAESEGLEWKKSA